MPARRIARHAVQLDECVAKDLLAFAVDENHADVFKRGAGGLDGFTVRTLHVELNGDQAPGNRAEETNLGDLITDAMLWSLTEQNPGSITEVDPDNIISLTNGGGIRAWIHQGDISKKDINTVLPFGNTVAVVYVTGAELLEALTTPPSFSVMRSPRFVSGLHLQHARQDRRFPAGGRYRLHHLYRQGLRCEH